MKKIGVADLKAKLSEHLRTVRKGGEITVLDRDQPIARIVPITPRAPLAVREALRGYRNLGEIKMPPPSGLRVDAVDLLMEDRNADR